MVHGLFNSKQSAEKAIPEVKKALRYDEEDPDYFIGIQQCKTGTLYSNGILKESRSSVYD